MSAQGAMSRRIMVDPLSYFSFQPVLLTGITKAIAATVKKIATSSVVTTKRKTNTDKVWSVVINAANLREGYKHLCSN